MSDFSPNTALGQPRQRLVIGVRQSRPKARGRSLTPGAAWRRLYSARSTSASVFSTIARVELRLELLARAVELDVRLEHRVEQLVGRQRLVVSLVGPQLGRRRPLDRRDGDQLAARRARSGAARGGTRRS